jgi:hypothetical protein
LYLVGEFTHAQPARHAQGGVLGFSSGGRRPFDGRVLPGLLGSIFHHFFRVSGETVRSEVQGFHLRRYISVEEDVTVFQVLGLRARLEVFLQ